MKKKKKESMKFEDEQEDEEESFRLVPAVEAKLLSIFPRNGRPTRLFSFPIFHFSFFSGANSVVCEVTDLQPAPSQSPSQSQLAMKVIAKSAVEFPAVLEREVTILTSVKHPHIVNLHQFIETPDTFYLTFDL